MMIHSRSARLGHDAVTVLAGLWLIAGLFSDGWAHHNVPELEGFFTPWHGVLYSGLVVSAAWFFWLGRGGGRRWYLDVPAGYGWGVVGLGVFAVGGVADMLWHLVLGVEAGIDALLSPSHLVLLSGGLLVLTSALRSRWAAGDTGSLVAMTSVTLVAALAAFFLLYVNEFVRSAPTTSFVALPEGHPRHTESELPAAAGVAGFLVTTALLAVPLAWTWSLGPARRGLLTMLISTVAWLSAAVVDFEAPTVAGAAGATFGALVGELIIPLLESRFAGTRLRVPLLTAVAVCAVWSGHLTTLALTAGLAWPAELWFGVIVLSSLAAAALGGLTSAAGAAGQHSGEPESRHVVTT